MHRFTSMRVDGGGVEIVEAEVIRIYLIAGAVLAAILGGLFWHDRHLATRLKASQDETAQVTALLANERKNRQIEQADRKHNDETVISLQAELDRIRAVPAPVSVYCRPVHPKLPSESGTSAGTVGAPVTGGDETPLRDIGSALGDARREAESNAAVQRKLAQWELARTH